MGNIFSSIWTAEYSDLAKFNSDNDKSKYSESYIQKMEQLQEKYNDEIKEIALKNGYIVI